MEALRELRDELDLKVGGRAEGAENDFAATPPPPTTPRCLTLQATVPLPTMAPLQDKPLYLGGVSSGASFALKIVNELKEGEANGVFSEVLAIDPEKDSFDVSAARLARLAARPAPR